MIEEFSFGNFRSFKDIQTLNMTAAKIKSKKTELNIHNIIQSENKPPLLKSKAIYGANASGKSNVVKAFNAFVRIVKNSLKDDEVLQIIEPFLLSTENENEPTFFQLIFRLDGVKYRYGFEATDTAILSEWLFATKKREVQYFVRENNEILEIDKTNLPDVVGLITVLGKDNGNIISDSSLFLSFLKSIIPNSLLARLQKEISSIIIVNGLYSKRMYDYAHLHFQFDEVAEFSNSLLKESDTGIADVESISLNEDGDKEIQEKRKKRISDLQDEIMVSFKEKFDKNHKRLKEDEVFDFERQESEGTKKLFTLSPVLYYALKQGKTLIIDEFDARFHPLLTQKIVELFNSNRNDKGQLIFVTHDTNLLSADLLRRDQIEFVEKDRYGASHLYSLVQFKGTRNTDSFEKNYIQGKYGAIPFLGNFEELIKTETDA